MEVLVACVVLVLLVCGSAAGMHLQKWLREHHRSRDTIDSVRVILSIVVTFSALVLGLLVTSAKSDFDSRNELYKRYGISLISLHQQLEEFGPDAAAVRRMLRTYTAAVFALSWPDSPRPSGTYPTQLHPIAPGSDEIIELTALLRQIDEGVHHLSATGSVQQSLLPEIREGVRQVRENRWTLVEHSNSRLSPVFLALLVLWLLIVFFTFGVVSSRNSLTMLAVLLCAFSAASSLYLTLDLDTSLGGFISVSNQPFKDALWHMDHEEAP